MTVSNHLMGPFGELDVKVALVSGRFTAALDSCL